ncbi:unnamed protein product [Vitrella brassicaformis CCMP3155]|uniref:Glutaredoxin domain-containing protein n=1 Tax=Vitrella brassicaformis (strain CCMP3155) TaxID=1169540 RepID=A0A0G4ET03_VITBC|nr:unnamed protein product [Vitrella brassicaformis CCMP3155]|eukprot:CEM01783.1 unnamed protein product [Vitrella brassicaformis CCMP3155]
MQPLSACLTAASIFKLAFVVLSCMAAIADAFSLSLPAHSSSLRQRSPSRALRRHTSALYESLLDSAPSPPEADQLDEATRERIAALVRENPVLVFMKGTPEQPQCGFSNTMMQVLQVCGVQRFKAVDVLSDERIRQGIKVYSEWPTIPQLYVNGEFLGGSDTAVEMYSSGELQELLEVAQAS